MNYELKSAVTLKLTKGMTSKRMSLTAPGRVGVGFDAQKCKLQLTMPEAGDSTLVEFTFNIEDMQAILDCIPGNREYEHYKRFMTDRWLNTPS